MGTKATTANAAVATTIWYRFDDKDRIQEVKVLKEDGKTMTIDDAKIGITKVPKWSWGHGRNRVIFYKSKSELVETARKVLVERLADEQEGLKRRIREVASDRKDLAKAKSALAAFDRKHKK